MKRGKQVTGLSAKQGKERRGSGKEYCFNQLERAKNKNELETDEWRNKGKISE